MLPPPWFIIRATVGAIIRVTVITGMGTIATGVHDPIARTINGGTVRITINPTTRGTIMWTGIAMDILEGTSVPMSTLAEDIIVRRHRDTIGAVKVIDISGRA